VEPIEEKIQPQEKPTNDQTQPSEPIGSDEAESVPEIEQELGAPTQQVNGIYPQNTQHPNFPAHPKQGVPLSMHYPVGNEMPPVAPVSQISVGPSPPNPSISPVVANLLSNGEKPPTVSIQQRAHPNNNLTNGAFEGSHQKGPKHSRSNKVRAEFVRLLSHLRSQEAPYPNVPGRGPGGQYYRQYPQNFSYGYGYVPRANANYPPGAVIE
jgi:hypothetical protein